MSEERDIPTGRLGRLAKLARAGANTGIALVRAKAAEASAERVAAILGELRGLATKVGQMASYVDGLLPPEQREAFERSMARLRDAAPRSAPAEIRKTIERELGRSIDDVFAEWSDEPIASASIGQVHRARLHDGRTVAVKVQHHGIAEAMEADLRNAGLLEIMAKAFGLGRFEVGRLLEEVRTRFREELDYVLEADRYRRFAELHRRDPLIRIPAVIDEASSRRVLVTEFVEGLAFEAAITAPPALRRAWAETMWRFVYGSILLGGLFNADPHPGNYRFFEDGGIGFLDFGCVQQISPYHHRSIVHAQDAAERGDFEAFQRCMSPIVRAHSSAQQGEMVKYMRLAVAPVLDSPFHVTREYTVTLAQKFREMAVSLTKIKSSEYEALPEGMLFLNRLQFGFYSVLARFDVEVDYAAAERIFIEEALALVRDYPDREPDREPARADPSRRAPG